MRTWHNHLQSEKKLIYTNLIEESQKKYQTWLVYPPGDSRNYAFQILNNEISNNMKRKVEVFTAGCPVCDPVVSLVKETACSNCDVVIYNMAEEFNNREVMNKLKSYGVMRIPAIAVNGALLSCCTDNGILKQDLIDAGIGQPV